MLLKIDSSDPLIVGWIILVLIQVRNEWISFFSTQTVLKL